VEALDEAIGRPESPSQCGAEAVARFRSANPRVFGSALHGADEEGSDLDILVDALSGTTLFDLGGKLCSAFASICSPRAICRRKCGRECWLRPSRYEAHSGIEEGRRAPWRMP